MTSRIERIARASSARRMASHSASETGAAAKPRGHGLPVPVGVVREVPRAEPPAGDAIIEAQLIGQEGQRRGLRGGQSVLDTARATYNRVEWSGAWDRRSRKGRKAREEV